MENNKETPNISVSSLQEVARKLFVLEQLLAEHGYFSSHYRSTAKENTLGLIDRASNNDIPLEETRPEIAVPLNAVATQCNSGSQTSPSSRSSALISRVYASLATPRSCLFQICCKFANRKIRSSRERGYIYRAVTHGVVDDSRERERCNFTPIITSLVLLTNSGATVIINFACVPVEYAY